MAWNSGHRSGNQKIHVLSSSLSQLTLNQVSSSWGSVFCGEFYPWLTRTLLKRFAAGLGEEKTKDKNSLHHHHQATELVSSLPARRIIGIFQEKILTASPGMSGSSFCLCKIISGGAKKATLVSFGVSHMNEIVVISVESWAGSAQKSTGCSFVCQCGTINAPIQLAKLFLWLSTRGVFFFDPFRPSA